jgi:Tfp pilus assembly protein PilO
MPTNNPSTLNLMLTSAILGTVFAAIFSYVGYFYLLTPHSLTTATLQKQATQKSNEVATLQQLKSTYEDFLSKLTQADKDSLKLASLLPNEQALPEIQTWAANTCSQRGLNLIYFSRVGNVINQKGVKAITLQMEAQGAAHNVILMLQDFSRSQRLLEIKSAKIEQPAPSTPNTPPSTNSTPTANSQPPNTAPPPLANLKATAKIEFLAYIRQEPNKATTTKEVSAN